MDVDQQRTVADTLMLCFNSIKDCLEIGLTTYILLDLYGEVSFVRNVVNLCIAPFTNHPVVLTTNISPICYVSKQQQQQQQALKAVLSEFGPAEENLIFNIGKSI